MEEDFVALAGELRVERAVASFCWEATGGNFDAALEMLQSHVQEAQGGGGGGGGAVPAPVQQHALPDEEPVRAPIRPTGRQVLVGHSGMVPWAAPVRAPPPEAFNPFSRHGLSPGAADRVSGKREELERMYRPPLEICFVGDFEAAVREAERLGRPLLVNVQDETEFGCQLLNRDTWRDEALKRFVSKHFVLWQPSAASSPGRFYAQFYPVQQFPHLALLDAASRFRELVLEGPITAEALQARLAEYLRGRAAAAPEALPAPAPAAPPAIARMSSLDLSEREQLERAIAESLQQDEDGMELEDDEEEQSKKRRVSEEEEDEMMLPLEEPASPPKRRRTDEPPPEPPGSALPPDTTLRVRDGSGRSETVRVHSRDTLARLAWVVARAFGLPGAEGFDLTTVMPKVYVTALPPESLVGSHGLGGSILVLQPREQPKKS